MNSLTSLAKEEISTIIGHLPQKINRKSINGWVISHNRFPLEMLLLVVSKRELNIEKNIAYASVNLTQDAI